ncbi:MAG: (d)CMP kinase [Verrucomicrobia bacterium]|jgi:cytidylate kinase|nr:MAG: (d)CMP kinase [Verrucomicrobiota bacterium]
MQEQSHRVIAIDGPAASGKSSVARELARQLGFIYVNSGAIYRAITWHILQNRIDPEDGDCIEKALRLAAISGALEDNESRVLINGADPGNHLRDDCVNESVARVSQFPVVRQIVAERLHEHAQTHDLIVEGRDIGSVVFPNTPYKFYVDASPAVRLQRRAAQGGRDEIALRDRADSLRPVSPLVIAKDANVIDTSHLTIQQVISEIVGILAKMGLPIQAI